MIVVVKNYTSESKMIDDLGIEIPSDIQIDLSELFSFFEIMSSDDLKNYVNTEVLIINDGTNDLSTNDGLEYITF